MKKILLSLGNPSKLKILYISTYKPNYTRTETLLELFKENKINFKSVLVDNSKLKYFKALYCTKKYDKDYDLIFVAFRGQEILPFVKMVTKKPIIFDAFISVYDTLCFDRKKFKPNSIFGKTFKWYDEKLCSMSKIVLVDTKSHKEYFEKEFNAKNIDYLYLGCNKEMFKPIKIKKDRKEKIVFWYGYANPLQGADIILKSAKLLEDKGIIFRLVGPIRKKYSKLLNELKLKNVEIIDLVSYDKLPIEINKADVCLGGHFSKINKAKRVIAGKTYQFLACGKTTLVGDNLANKELFKESNQLKFVELENPRALADKILEVIR